MEETIIDWQTALESVSDDKEFLAEVLCDLMAEAEASKTEIAAAIESMDFEAVMKSAHRIKGSASYLACNALKESALKLQKMGQEGKTPADMDNIRDEYAKFVSLVEKTGDEAKNMP